MQTYNNVNQNVVNNNRVFAMTFEGRATRATMWKAFLIQFLIVVFVGLCLEGDLEEAFSSIFDFYISASVSGLLFIPLFVRRFHDLGMSGWHYLKWVVLGLIPFVGFIFGIGYFVLLYCIDGNPCTNAYGPCPKGRNFNNNANVASDQSKIHVIPVQPVQQVQNSKPALQKSADFDNLEASLIKLAKLREQGLITEEEYQKKRSDLF